VQSLLARHSTYYERARPSVRFDGTVYRVVLSGDGATFCLNKGTTHNSQRVYMEIVSVNGAYVSRMRCWCKCVAVRFGGQPCSKFKSAPIDLSDAERSRLFVVPVADASSASQHIHKQLQEQASRVRELMRKVQSRQMCPTTSS